MSEGISNRPRASSVAREAAEELAEANVPEPEASAEILLSELLGIRRGDLPFHEVPDDDIRVYSSYISRRKGREPVHRILGYAYFRNLKLFLSLPEKDDVAGWNMRGSRTAGEGAKPILREREREPPPKPAASRREAARRDTENRDASTNVSGSDIPTLIPRPDTESVVDAALVQIDERGFPCRVLDIGAGSGAIAISIADERPGCEVHASDVSEAALRVAKRNAEANGAKVEFHLADVAEGLEEFSGGFDLLVSNPPYIETEALETLAPEVRDHDPASALDGGSDGLDFYRRIFDEVPSLLKSGADVVLEVGDGQSEAVLDLGVSAGFSPLGVRDDLAGTPRAVLMRWGG